MDAFSSQPLETIKKRTGTSTKTIRIGTRPSPLAKIQANQVASKLERLSENENIRVEIIDITATGDEENTKHFQRESKIDAPLAVQSVDFTSTLDDALLRNEIDVAVHSCKDIPPANRWCMENGNNLLTKALYSCSFMSLSVVNQENPNLTTHEKIFSTLCSVTMKTRNMKIQD